MFISDRDHVKSYRTFLLKPKHLENIHCAVLPCDGFLEKLNKHILGNKNPLPGKRYYLMLAHRSKQTTHPLCMKNKRNHEDLQVT